MKITLLGTGDSAGIPQIGCDCETCERHKREGRERTRFSILVDVGHERLLIDASPDLRTQFLREGIESIDALLFTHAHYDHYAGLGNLYRVIWNQLPVYGTPEVLDRITDEYDYLPFPSPQPVEEFRTFEFAGLELTLFPVHHPPVDSYGVVIQNEDSKVVITGDTSREIPEESLGIMSEPELLIADAFTPADVDSDFISDRISDDGMNFASKHMTYEGALDLADFLDADKVVMVHLSHYFRQEYDELGNDGDVFEV